MKGKRIESLPPDYLSRLAAGKGSGREKMLTLLRVAGDFGVHSTTIRKLGISAHPSERVREMEAKGFDIHRETDYIDGRNGVRFYLLDEPPAGACAEGQSRVSGDRGAWNRPSPALSVDPGGWQNAHPTGTPTPQGSGSDTNPAEPSAGGSDGPSPGGLTEPLGEAVRLFDPGEAKERPLSAWTDAEAA